MNTRRTPDLEDLNPDQRERLLQFKEQHGRAWKMTLINKWCTGMDAQEPGGHFLRQIRNNFGPQWLEKLKE